MIARAARSYGASPLHLAGHLALFALAFWALSHALELRQAANFAIWFVAAIVLHDLVFLPAYSLLDRALVRACEHVPERLPSPVNYARVPAVLSGLLFLVFFPLVLARADTTFVRAAGYTPSGYATRWLVAVAVLFAGSALLYAIRATRSGGRRPSGR